MFKHFRWQQLDTLYTKRDGEIQCIFGRVGTRDGIAMYDGVVILANNNGAQLLINEPFYINNADKKTKHYPTERDMQIVMCTFWEEVAWDTWG
jgi:hypothetical protein